MTSDDRVVTLWIDIPHREWRLAGRHYVLRDVESDVADATVGYGTFDVVEVRDGDLDEGIDLFTCVPFGPPGAPSLRI